MEKREVFAKIKKFLEEINTANIYFKKHFHDRSQDRPVSEDLIRAYLKKTDRLLRVEEQSARNPNEEKYKLWIRLSNRYCLIIITVISGKSLYIITAWNREGKWKRQE